MSIIAHNFVNRARVMPTSNIETLVKEIAAESMRVLDKTGTPPLPCYYVQAFTDVVMRYSPDEQRAIDKLIKENETMPTNNVAESLDFARETLQEYSETATKIKEMVLSDTVLDLTKLNQETYVSATILEELRAHYSSLSVEIKKAEMTIVKLESDLEKIEMDSFVDPLTRLRSPMLLKRQLAQILEFGQNRNLDLWVTLITIDDYEKLKETYGYVVMEKVILFIAKSLQGTIRSDNKVYRYNDRPAWEGVFCVVFNRMDKQGAYMAAGRARSRVEASKLVYAGKLINVTLSAAVVPHLAADTVETIMNRAESALERIAEREANSVYVIED
ncbi:hypothetical protein AGMMS50229_08130 [Campylobacterota bacterium]|nr:hypothetical protein AGMMS50229_08130 [Campylobacterota bacterium]